MACNPPRQRDDGDDDSPPANESRWTVQGRPYRMQAWSAAEFRSLTPCDRSMLRSARRLDMVRVQVDGSWHLLIAG
jgi:hypothetical protein